MKKLTNKQYQKKCDDEQFNRLEKEIIGSVIGQRLKSKGFVYLKSVEAKYKNLVINKERINTRKLEVTIPDTIIDEIVLIPLNLYGHYQTIGPTGYAVYIKKGALS